MPVWLSILFAALGVAGTIFITVGKLLARVASLQEDMNEIKASIPSCQKERRNTESELHGRITEVQRIQAGHVVRTEGIDQRVGHIERKVFNGHANA